MPVFPDDFPRVLMEVQTVERVERTYVIALLAHPDETDEDLKRQARAKLMSGDFAHVMDNDASIEDIVSVERQHDD